jgi:hypothetical protein
MTLYRKEWCSMPHDRDMAGASLDPRKPADHVTMMKTPDLWPLGKVLALKRDAVSGAVWPPEDAMCFSMHNGRLEELGLMVASTKIGRWTVVRLNLLDQRVKAMLWNDTIDASVTTYEFEDAEGVFDAGWRVD